MSDEREKPENKVPERRFMLRYPSKASTLVIRESDVMRAGLEAQLTDISIGGVGVTLSVALEINEHVKLKLTNEVQHFAKDTHGIVRFVSPLAGGRFHIGIELLARLTPLEVLLFRMGIPIEGESDGQRWI